jgi:hypothetical protein
MDYRMEAEMAELSAIPAEWVKVHLPDVHLTMFCMPVAAEVLEAETGMAASVAQAVAALLMGLTPACMMKIVILLEATDLQIPAAVVAAEM